ncbi:hypothetical protein F1640_23150 [Novosphingobium sp. NBM11]|uniref:hypothetical protein n=1 Tax=Novosphingobium sp. NBM11 TaxID=2596914 RepID=UPI0018924FAA|nr:hypothetical protein [Novosphingobium sp. NBM11]MBF5092773.1 hypothetical protein [Novosphingobium sp. NBM11]
MKRLAGAGLLLGGIGAGVLGTLLAVSRMDADAEAGDSDPPVSTAGAGLHLDAGAQARAGIRLSAPMPATQHTEAAGYARAIDLTALSAIASEVTAATAAADASGREAARLASLASADQGASQRDVEAARSQAVADRARLGAACQRIGLEFGAGLARLGCGSVPGLAREAAAGKVAVLRIDFPDGVVPAGSAITIDAGDQQVSVRALGPAAMGDTQLQTAGTLALLRGAAVARAGVGRILAAHRTGAGTQGGYLISREALVRVDGALCAYRTAGRDGFERVTLQGAVPRREGWFVPGAALRANDRIVVSGAGTLLGLEHAAPADGPADGGDK